ncbi:MAG TPA: family 10 glycosylhydrolase [Candidatus Angelobacter sp.]|nr:family 10 glycosylhydrolase [Candidatus Angelobacter sp.]
MKSFFLAALLLFPAWGCVATTYQNSSLLPPPVEREFRGVWIATVANIDWPSKPGLPTAQQKAELISLLNRAAQAKLNAVIFQVRPACDAMYPSAIEPWSEYLTGAMGKPPEPFYDPLQFAIEEAHKRGLELHAWFNPYRALHKSHTGRIAPNHISKTHPELVRSYGEYLWLDPGERAVQDYSLRVIMDVVKRYDIDGVQFDDYFYPDPSTGGNRDFPDAASWKKYGAGGKLNRGDWRRENVNTFISRVYTSIKAAKPWVKFGISPFGIWRPGDPPGITGSDAYNKFYADSRKWLVAGWVDYFSPQLYWRIAPKEQSFPALLNWWSQQNPRHRHLWPGLAVSSAISQGWSPNEIPDQLRLIRKNPGANGYIFYNASSLFTNSPRGDQLRHTLETEFNHQPALVPASPWLGSGAPAKPNFSITDSAKGVLLHWSPAGTNAGPIRWWVVQTKSFNDWQTQILPAETTSQSLPFHPEAAAVTAIDRVGNASPARVLEIYQRPAEKRILLKR